MGKSVSTLLLPKSKYIICFLFVIALALINNFFDLDQINKLIENSHNQITGFSISAAILIFFLRSISIVIPILPGTYCSVIAGYIYGFKSGMIIIFFADFISCFSSFLISRRFGRGFVRKILGDKQMKRIEIISKEYLEHNFFMMTGLLMTQFFDFVCYAIGLTKVTWKKFMPALVVSIIISDAPFVAGGYTLNQLGSISLKEILGGNVNSIEGTYLIIFIISILTVFGLGLLNIFLSKKTKVN